MSLTDLLEAHIVDSLGAERGPAQQAQHEAFDIALEAHGQAEWQHARRDKPEQFWAAKVEIQSGPHDLWCEAEHGARAREILFRFGWQANEKRWRFNQTIDISLLYGDATYLPEDAALRHMLGDAAFQVTKGAGVKTQLSVRSNREALAEMKRRDEQKQKAPTTR